MIWFSVCFLEVSSFVVVTVAVTAGVVSLLLVLLCLWIKHVRNQPRTTTVDEGKTKYLPVSSSASIRTVLTLLQVSIIVVFYRSLNVVFSCQISFASYLFNTMNIVLVSL